MQKSAYYCDHCKKIIGDKIHISLNMNVGLSGLAVPPTDSKLAAEYLMNPNHRWHIERVPNGFMHFHVLCIGKYFEIWTNKLLIKKDGKNKK